MPENINPPIGSRSTCRECGGKIIYWSESYWRHFSLGQFDYTAVPHTAVPIDSKDEPVKPMTNNPTIGTIGTCAMCGKKIQFTEAYVTEGELIRTWVHVPETLRSASGWHQARPLYEYEVEPKPSHADARTVEELVGEIRNMLTTCKYDAYDGCVTGDCPHEKQFECVGALAAMLTKRETEIDSSIAALDELARRLGVGK